MTENVKSGVTPWACNATDGLAPPTLFCRRPPSTPLAIPASSSGPFCAARIPPDDGRTAHACLGHPHPLLVQLQGTPLVHLLHAPQERRRPPQQSRVRALLCCAQHPADCPAASCPRMSPRNAACKCSPSPSGRPPLCSRPSPGYSSGACLNPSMLSPLTRAQVVSAHLATPRAVLGVD